MARLSQALNEKIYHDISNSVNIIDNCLSLMNSSKKEIASSAHKVVTIESANLVKKIIFFKYAYSVINNQNVTTNELLDTLRNFTDNKITIPVESHSKNIEIEPSIAQIIICLFHITHNNFNKNHQIQLSLSYRKNFEIVMEFVGKGISLNSDKFAVLRGKHHLPINVHNCQEHYIHALCNNNDLKIELVNSDNLLQFTIIKQGVKTCKILE